MFIRWHFSEGLIVRFRKAETHTNAPQRHNTLQTMAIEVREGQVAAAPQIAQVAAASSRNYCCSMRVSARGANLRPNLETTSGEEIPCPDLRLDRDETHPFSVYFLILEVVRTIIRLHMQCTQILL